MKKCKIENRKNAMIIACFGISGLSGFQEKEQNQINNFLIEQFSTKKPADLHVDGRSQAGSLVELSV